jgi:parallel beta-helix repeat protein
MPSNYPLSLDDGTNLANNRVTGNPIPVSDHNDLANAAITLETKLGTGSSTPTTTDHVLKVTGTGASAWGTIPAVTPTSASVSKTVGPANADYVTTGASTGITDDVQIKAACDAVIAAGGGTVYIQPKATPYNITRRIIILGSNLIIKGGGPGATVLKLANEVNQEIFVIGNGFVGDAAAGDGPTIIPCNNVWFKDMTLDGNKTNQTATTLYGGSATRNLLRFRSDAQTSYGGGCIRVEANNGKQNGLSCESHAAGGFYFCRANNNGQNGIWCENGSNWDMSHNYTSNNGQDLAAGGAGITILSFSGYNIVGNDLKGDKGGGIRLITTQSGNVTGNVVYRAGWQGGVSDNPATGIYTVSCQNVAITGNNIYAAQGNGLSMNADYYCTISNNTFRRNGQYADNTYDDIYLTFIGAANNTNNVFIGNTFQNDTATYYTNKTAHNINSNSPTAHHSSRFIGNMFGAPATSTVDNMFSGSNYWGPGHLGVTPIGIYGYGYFSLSAQTIDPSLGAILTGTGYNSTVAVTIPSGKYIGQQFTFIYNQDSGNKQLTWAANVKWSGGKAPIFSGIASTLDKMTFVWDGTNWYGEYSASAPRYLSLGYIGNPQTLNPDLAEVFLGTGYSGTSVVNISSGRTAGQQITFIFLQDVGNKTITWGSNVVWSGGVSPVLSTAPNSRDVMTFTWDGASWNGSISKKFGSQTVTGNITVNAIATASAPIIVVNGTAGTTTYGYRIVAVNTDEADGIPSAIATTATGNATLTTSNFNSLQWTAIPGANRYKVLRSISGGAYDYLTTTTGTSLSDQGAFTPATYTPATVNPGGNATIGGNLSLIGAMATKFSEAVVALTDAATISTNLSLGNQFTVTFAGNRTIANPTNPTSGQKVIYRITQDATGSRTVTWGANFRFSTDIPSPTLTITAAKTDYVEFIYNSTDTKYDCLRVVKGF